MNDSRLLYNPNDVRDRFLEWAEANPAAHPPGGVLFARPMADTVLIGCAGTTQERSAVDVWLEELFGPRYDRRNNVIVLESCPEVPRVLPVEVEDVGEDESPRLIQRPRFAPPKVIWFGMRPDFPEMAESIKDGPSVICLHAYKGGVGRTTTALGLAIALSTKAPVLLIDFDLEAPGLSILYHSRQPNPAISAADLLALAHRDASPFCEETVNLVSDRLRDQADGNIFVLPAFRWSQAEVGSARYLDITPDDLTQSARKSPYLLGTLLSRIGARIGVGTVLVDMRAGLTDLAASLLLDPRMHHIQLTTLNGQSIVGTRSVLMQLGKAASNAPPCIPISIPAIVLNQIPMLLQGTQVEIDAVEKLQEVIEREYPRPSDRDVTSALIDLDIVEADQGAVIARINYAAELAAIPSEWSKALLAIRNSGLPNLLARDLERFLPPATSAPPPPPISGATGNTGTNAVSPDTHAKSLAEYTERLTYAEKAAETDFLKTKALQRLASDAVSAPPVVVLVGARGAGKTFTCMRLVDFGNWNRFIYAINGSSTGVSATMLPVFWAADLGDAPQQQHIQRRSELAARLGTGNTPPDLTEMHSLAQELLGHATTSKEFRDAWLELIARSAGAQTWDLLVEKSIFVGEKIVAIIDGFENLFPQFQEDENQKKAIRSILQDVPQFLRQVPGRQVGLIVATRNDIVSSAIPQNVEQFIDLYSPYRLRWNWAEASALVAWAARNSHVINLSDTEISGFPDIPQADREERLRPLWGYKVGPDGSREARSLEWVMSYLSDFNGQLQARDLVRFLSAAAKRSQSAKRPDNRVLAPAAMRSAIEDCSRERVKEIKSENPALREILDRISQQPSENRFNPLGPNDLQNLGLSKADIDLMVMNGAIFLSNGEYYIPEILRVGLGFRYAGGARRKVVGLMREAAARNKAGF